jgi:hypothetical protein
MNYRAYTARYRSVRSVALLISVLTAFICASPGSWASPAADRRSALRPRIRCVSAIGLTVRTTFTIVGNGFGVIGAGASWKFIDVKDVTGNWDEESVKVALWSTTKIVLDGFTYDHFNSGDRVEIMVWNPFAGGSFLDPSAGGGPALYRAIVGSQRPCS